MAETTILVHMFLAFTLFGIAKGDCNACPAPSYLSCPTTASISAYSWTSYSDWCDDSSSYVTINSIQVAQGDGDDDSFTVTVMDEDGYNNYKNGRSYQYYVDIGTGDSSATCYRSSSSVNFAPGTKIHTVIKCDNRLETCNLRVKIDGTCHSTDPCSGVSCGSNGYCRNGLCVCNQGYSGAQCQNYIDPCAETFCDHGYCTDGLCVCNQGYSGAQCENYIDPCAGIFCDHGYCTDGLCVCNQNYSGAQCKNFDDSNHQKNKIIIAASSAGGALLLLLLISCGIAAALRSRRRRSPQVAMVLTVPHLTDPKLTLVSAMEQQQ